MQRRSFLKRSLLASYAMNTGALATLSAVSACGGADGAAKNSYKQTNLVANSPKYAPQILDPRLVNAWGIAIRPAGAGGHFWVTGAGISFEYVGDVRGQPLIIDDLDVVMLPASGDSEGAANGVVFNSGKNFNIQQAHERGTISNAAKFIFVSDNGVLSAWTERKRSDGGFDRPQDAVAVVDYGKKGSAFFGLAINPQEDQLFVVDFGANPLPCIRVFDQAFREQDLAGRFPNPFLSDSGFKPGDLVPFNIQTLNYDGAYGRKNAIFVSYVYSKEDPDNPGKLLAAEESAGPGQGRLVEYTPDGQLVAVWDDQGMLNGPWGMVIAPDNFGAFSSQLLVSNFSDGTIVGFDLVSKQATGYLRDPQGKIVSIPGIWNLLFGNGQSLGDSNALYFAAGPEDETDGLFGSLRLSQIF